MKNNYHYLQLTAIFMPFTFMASAGPAKPPKRKYIDRANMDLSVTPGDNFFRYANAPWLKNNTVPPSTPPRGSFAVSSDESSAVLATPSRS